MARKPVMTLDEVIAEIEDTLPELTIVNPVLGRVGVGRGGLTPGYYIQYQISTHDVFRAVFLGDGVKVDKFKRKFDEWSQNWRV